MSWKRFCSALSVCACAPPASAAAARATSTGFELIAISSVGVDDRYPVRAFAGRVLVQQPEGAARLVDRVHRERLGFLARGDQVAAGRADGEAARLLFGRRAAEVGQLAARRIDAEPAERAAGALRGVQELAVRREV